MRAATDIPPQIADRDGTPLRHWLAMYALRDRRIGSMPEPQWRILLDLAVNGPCVVTSACVASGVPATTALRHIRLLETSELIVSAPADWDRRLRRLSLSDKGAELLLSATFTLSTPVSDALPAGVGMNVSSHATGVAE
jgi:DNA-binding MarR family transcriptional regulator